MLFWFVSCLPGIVTTARCDETTNQWARAQAERIAQQPLLVSPMPAEGTAWTVFPCFQFEYHWIFNASRTDRIGVRWIVERGQLGAALLLLSPDGIPMLFCDSAHLAVPDARHQKWIRPQGPSSFSLAISSLKRLPGELAFLTEREHLLVDFRNLVCEIGADASTVIGSPYSRTVVFKNANGSRAELRLTRERRPGQFPLTTLSLHDQDDTSLVLSNFYVYANPTAESIPLEGLPRRSLPSALKSVLHETDLVARGSDAEIKAGFLSTILRSIVSHDWKELLKGPLGWSNQARVGKSLLPEISPHDTLSLREEGCLRNLLAHVTHSREPPLSDTDHARALEELSSVIAGRIVQRIRVDCSANLEIGDEVSAKLTPWNVETTGVPVYVAGHERWRTAQWLEIVAGPELSRALYDAISQVIVDRKTDREDRLSAMDLLGEIGVPPTSRLLIEMEAAVSNERDPLIRGLFSSVKVRTGVPDEADVARLKTLANDTRLPRWLRLVGLEALLLSDETAGQESWIAQTLGQATMESRDYATRCLFAAGCSKEGREVLRCILVNRRPSSVFAPAMFLAETSIGPDDPQWGDCLKVAKAVALEDAQPVDLRIKAAQIAHRGPPDPQFRDQFVRAAFHSRQLRLFHYMSALDLPQRSCGDRYLDEFARMMDSAIPELRRAAAYRLARSLPSELPAEEQRAVAPLLVKMQDHEDSYLGLQSLLIWADIRETRREFGSNLTSGYLDMFRREPDAYRQLSMAIALGRGLGRRFEMPFRTLWNDLQIMPVEKLRRLAEQHQDQIRRQVEAWLSTSVEAEEP